jgi:hypothetical protein
MEDSIFNSRKRSRASSPKPPAIAATTQENSQAYQRDLAFASQLREPKQRNVALNELLRLSFTHEKNYSLSSDAILKELVKIAVYDCLEWKEEEGSDDTPVFSSHEAWITPPTPRRQAWARHFKKQLGIRRNLMDAAKLKTLEVILVILRNLSFVAANLRMLVYSPDVIALLVGCLYEGTENSLGGEEMSSTNNTSLCFSAIHTLLHLAPYLDVTGQRLLSDRLFYKPSSVDGPKVPDASSFGQAVGGHWGFGGLWLAKRLDTKEDVIANCQREFVLSLTADYLVSVWSIFSALHQVLVNCKSPRCVILMALDLLQELINHARVGVVGTVQEVAKDEIIPTIRTVLVHMPDGILERLIDLLHVARLGPDSLDYVDPVHNIVTRVTTLKLLTGYDATVDTDVRDRALDVLVPLLELDSPRMASRIGGQRQNSTMLRLGPRLLDSVVPILTTRVGRNEASMLACQLLRELVQAKENKTICMYLQERLVDLAGRGDTRVSQLVWNHLFPPSLDDEYDAEEVDGGHKETLS